MDLMKDMKRTHMCSELNKNNVNKRVTLMGWVQTRRDLGGLIFIDLRDRTGIMQVVFDANRFNESFDKVESLRNEYVIAVSGLVVERSEETKNPKIPTGDIELSASELRILNKSDTPPIYIEENSKVSEALRLKYRYLDLRRPDMQKNIMLRHKVKTITRDFFNRNGFIDIDTPILTKSTPEGARDYLVPSRVHPGKFYALPQSPQLFKQLLMVSGFDRYYQIAKCFRDEDLRADRQPEFTQIDVEMSFVDIDDIISINEKLLYEIFKETIGKEITLPIKRMTYDRAMELYGTDKPDTRFDMTLKNLSDIAGKCDFKVFRQAVEKGGSVRGINAKGCGASMGRREIDGLVELAKEFGAKGMAWINITENELKSPITKFFSEDLMGEIVSRMEGQPGDLLMFIADKDDISFSVLSQLRLELGRRLGLIDKDKLEFLWITDFPLFEYDQTEKRFVSKHHPFTSPADDDINLLDTDPGAVRSKAYDIVLNGVELGGGSIRIHDQEVQQRVFKVLGFSKERAWEQFGFLLEAFKYGTPPHGGIAYGLDRLIMLLAQQNSIRDVIPFPKVQNASCLMTEAPNTVENKQLKELHIKLDE
ncbi:MAG: aspartate--tRNA ligase [Mahellales bacterium]|jgi:aspartyl-tRNA synthetase